MRLLALLPGPAEDVVACEVFVVPANNPPSYETISYVWGDRSDKITCIVNGQRARIQANLYDALHLFRFSSEPRVLWADALCINQSDTDGKNQQVARMAKDYASCYCVLVFMDDNAWRPQLPPEISRHSPIARVPAMRDPSPFHGMLLLATGACIEQVIRYIELPTDLHTDWCAYESRVYLQSSLFSMSLQRVLCSKRWVRVRTPQEANLPPRALMFCSGEVRDYVVVKAAVNSADYHSFQGCCQPSITDPRVEAVLLPTLNRLIRGVVPERDRPPPFSQLLWDHGSRQVFNPHDMVYGLLGLWVPQSETARRLCFRPRYDRPFEATYRDAVRDCIVSSGNLGILQVIGTSSSHRNIMLPSWTLHYRILGNDVLE